MSLKTCLVLAMCLTWCQNVYAMTQAEAEQALSDFNDQNGALREQISDIAHAQWELLHSQLDDEVASAKAAIDNITSTINDKLNQISDNLAAVNVDVSSCISTTATELKLFADDTNIRLTECYNNILIDGNARLDAAWSSILKQYTTTYYCAESSFIQCRDYESGKEDCYDFVNSFITRGNDRIPGQFDTVQAQILNQILEIQSPCKAMIEQEMNLYPTMLLDFASKCVESITTGAISTIC